MNDSRERWSHELRSAQEELAEQTIEVRAGQGAIRVVMSGTQECKEVEIDLDRLAEPERLSDLVLVAVNQAIRDSQLLAARRLSRFSDQMDE